MDDLTTLPAAVAIVSAADRLKTSLTDYGLNWVDNRLLPTTSIIPESLASLEREVDEACRPASEVMIDAWLTALWVVTKRPSGLNEFRSDNIFKVYIAALKKYPADLVQEALGSWTSTPKPNNAHHWWPSLGEIEDAIRGPSETRKLIQHAVKGWDMEKARHDRLSQLYRDLSILEAGDFTFNIKHLAHARRADQLRGIQDEEARVRAEIFKLEGRPALQRAAGDN